jgi:glutamyl-tRNA synthetase
VHSGGAKFDYEKAKWFNHEWIKGLPVSDFRFRIEPLIKDSKIDISDTEKLEKVIGLVKDRCTFLTDFYEQASYFFVTPEILDVDAVKPKWNEQKINFFLEFINKLSAIENWGLEAIEDIFKNLTAEKNIKPGELQMPLRVMLVGGKFGPPVFVIAENIGKQETIKRIENALKVF